MIKTINAAYLKCPNLPKSVNVNTGKQSTTAVSFNDDGWGDSTRGFTKLAAQIVELVHQFEKLERAAMEHSRVSTHAKESLTTLQNVIEEPDEWALLVKNYNSDDNDDSD